MGLDLRWPIGMLFTLVGLLLTVSGILARPESYQKALGININLVWGLALLVFGALMTFFAWRGGKKAAKP